MTDYENFIAMLTKANVEHTFYAKGFERSVIINEDESAEAWFTFDEDGKLTEVEIHSNVYSE